jgi:hypothetical protein
MISFTKGDGPLVPYKFVEGETVEKVFQGFTSLKEHHIKTWANKPLRKDMIQSENFPMRNLLKKGCYLGP